MFAAWFIAFAISGGVSLWIYGKMLKRNGNQRDTIIACVIIWALGFLILFAILKSLNI